MESHGKNEEGVFRVYHEKYRHVDTHGKIFRMQGKEKGGVRYGQRT